MEMKINFIAILAAVVVNFILGFLWYAGIFAKAWTKEMGYDPNMRPSKKEMMKGIALMIIGNFMFAWILAFYLAGWKYIPNSQQMGTFSFAFNSALSVWIGFYAPVHLSRVVWENIRGNYFSSTAVII